MDGGKSVKTPAHPRRWRWVPAALALMALGLLGASWWSLSQQDGIDALAAEKAGDRAAPVTSDTGPAAGLRAATIIDESSRRVWDGPAGSGAGANPPTAAAADATVTSPFAGIAAATAATRALPADTENPFVAPTSPITVRSNPATRAPRLPAAQAARPRDGSEPDLIATLLHNIQAQTGETPSGLDTLIQKMQTSTATEAAATDTREHGPRTGALPRSQQIQANLRECPPPNTARGLTCRQAICAVYAGRDPACPAP
ncbi:hypothetical protein H2514_12855 [Lysobacter sp. CW239]|jgi:hypothetical protein|nr:MULTISPECIES: hypothetical protein [Lysobacter]QOD91027.1 hypothetical protein H2514_12855 [Lysobacter sp. CW239]